MGYYHFLNPEVKKKIESILESQYNYISDEQERKRKIQEDLQKSEEEVLRRLPITIRQKILNMRKDKIDTSLRWVTSHEAQSISKSVVDLPVNLRVDPVELEISDISGNNNAIRTFRRRYGR